MRYSDWIKADQIAIVQRDKVMLTGKGQDGQEKYSIVPYVSMAQIAELYALIEHEDTPGLQFTDTVLDLTGGSIKTLRYHIDPRDYLNDSISSICTLETGNDKIDYVDPMTGIIASLISGGEIRFNDDVSYEPEDEEDKNAFNEFLELTEFFTIDDIKYAPQNITASKNPQFDESEFSKMAFSDIRQYQYTNVPDGISGINYQQYVFSLIVLSYEGEDKITRLIPQPQNPSADVTRKVQEYRIERGELKNSQARIADLAHRYRKDTLSLLSGLLRESNCSIEVFMDGKSAEDKGEEAFRMFSPDKAYVIINRDNETKSLRVPSEYGLDLAYLFDNLSIKEAVIDMDEMNQKMSRTENTEDIDPSRAYIG